MDALQELIERQCGALAVRQALACLTAAALRWRVGSGRWQRPARGLLVAHSGPIPVGDRVLRFPAVVLRTEPATVVAQVRAALEAAGWPRVCELVS
jgi:hypothetical protein